jgi:hypothetical protein
MLDTLSVMVVVSSSSSPESLGSPHLGSFGHRQASPRFPEREPRTSLNIKNAKLIC